MARATVVTEGERATITRLFPYIGRIKNDEIREQVIRVWARVWRESPHRELEGAPAMTSQFGSQTLVQHTNAAISGAWSLAEQLAEESGISVDFDVLVAAGLLHDVDKLVLYERKGGQVVEADLAEKLPHGVYGAHVALEEGLPVEVAHVIATHPMHSTIRPSTIEGVLIEQTDLAKAFAVLLASGKRPPGR